MQTEKRIKRTHYLIHTYAPLNEKQQQLNISLWWQVTVNALSRRFSCHNQFWSLFCFISFNFSRTLALFSPSTMINFMHFLLLSSFFLAKITIAHQWSILMCVKLKKGLASVWNMMFDSSGEMVSGPRWRNRSIWSTLRRPEAPVGIALFFRNSRVS